jgi:1-deoxy-D-xylulose-5-phosphate synthase
MIFEGLNDAAESREPMVVILNDNEMSIDKNVGGVSRHLYKLRMKEQYLGMKRRYRGFVTKLPGGKWLYRVSKNLKDRLKRFLLPATIFENMGLAYLGPVDGHDLPALIRVLKTARDMRVPVVVHVITRKGFGYLPAERDPARFHGIGKFDPSTGKSCTCQARVLR